MALDFKVKRLQIALFTPTIDLSNILTVGQVIIEASGGLLDGEPIVLPAIEAAPPEVPRIVLASKDGSYNCSVARNRVDVRFEEPGAITTRSLDELLGRLVPAGESIADAIKNGLSGFISRVGFVVEVISMMDGSSNEFVRDRFLKAEQFELPYEVQLGVLRRLPVDASFQVNRWFRVRTLRRREPPADDAGLSVTLDINTLPEDADKHDFDGVQVGSFCRRAAEMAMAEVGRYFEGE